MPGIKQIDDSYFSNFEKSKEVWKNRQTPISSAETEEIYDLNAGTSEELTDKKERAIYLYKQYQEMLEKGEYNENSVTLTKEILKLREEAKSDLEAEAKVYQDEIERLKKEPQSTMTISIIETNERELNIINGILEGNVGDFKEIFDDQFTISTVTKTTDGIVVAASKDGESSRLYVFDNNSALVGSVIIDTDQKITDSKYDASSNSMTVKTADGQILTYDVARLNRSIVLAGRYEGTNSGKYYATDGEKVIEVAKSCRGLSYDWGGVGEEGRNYDCSGLVAYAWTGVHSRTLPNGETAYTGTYINWPETTDPEPGDICVIHQAGGSQHTGLYIGTDENGTPLMIDAGDPIDIRPVQAGMIYVKYAGGEPE